MLYQICHGAVSFADEEILHDINFEIRNTEKIAVVGRNGCGKTTLLKLIHGDVELDKRDSDEDIFIAKAGNPQIGYLKQIAFEDPSVTLEQEVRKVFAPMERRKKELEAAAQALEIDYSEEAVTRYTAMEEKFKEDGGYYFEKEYDVIIRKFGFSEEERKKPLSEFSGGQQTKIAFIKLLLSKPDILLLDEPTNHLDITTIEWLETYLKNYPKAVVVVSHDRMFLDNVVDVVYEIEYGTATRYPGNYSNFMERKKENYNKMMKDYNAQQKEIARLQRIVDRFKNKPTKVSMAHSKEKAIEHMVKLEAPDRFDTRTFHANFQPDKEYNFGTNVQIGYFDQQMAMYSSRKTVLDDFWDEFPNLTETEARNALGAFMFTGEDVFKNIDMLSGGEKVRLALCKILKRRPNVLVLDEPTNHMDIVGKETLESMLKDFSGTLIFVSHDRYFVRKVANRLLVFEDGTTHLYQFGYEEYQEKLDREAAESGDDYRKNPAALGGAISQNGGTQQSKGTQETGGKKAYYNPGKERSKIEKKVKKAEEELAVKEEKLDALKQELLRPEYQSSYSKLTEIQGEIDALEEEIMADMENWEALSQQLEELES